MLSQEALKIMTEKDQEKLQQEGSKFLLTPEALRKHDILTGALELRQFACEDCDHTWWKTVPRTKLVSKCNKCKTKYDALPREKEFGIGRYKCTNCNHSFTTRCEATSERHCFNCLSTVKAPYIHPKFRLERRELHQKVPTPLSTSSPPPKYALRPAPGTISTTGYTYLRPQLQTTTRFTPPSFRSVSITSSSSSSGATGVSTTTPKPQAPQRKRVINASKVHDSTGSTASTFITQVEMPGYTSVIIPDLDSDDEEDIETDDSSSGIGSDSEQGSDTESGKEFAIYFYSFQICTIGQKWKPGFPGIVFSQCFAKEKVDSRGAIIKGEGIKLKIPQNAVRAGESVDIMIQGCLDGPFVLPDETVLVSPVYLFAPPYDFEDDITLTIEHFAKLESDEDCDDVYFVTSPTEPKRAKHGKEEEAYWEFCVYAQPTCIPKSQHGTLHLRHFCLGALARIFKRGMHVLS